MKDIVITVKTKHILSFLSGGVFRMTLDIILNFKARVGTGLGESQDGHQWLLG